jgi:hypothetical protein
MFYTLFFPFFGELSHLSYECFVFVGFELVCYHRDKVCPLKRLILRCLLYVCVVFFSFSFCVSQ